MPEETEVQEPIDVAPSSLAQLIGQRNAIAQVTVAIEAAFTDNAKMDHTLLAGPPGLGKTALDRVIATEMESELHEVLGQTITRRGDLSSLLLGVQPRDVVHVDECHQLAHEFQVALFYALDQRRIFLNGGYQRGGRIEIADFTLVLSTTEEHRVLQPLRDRMKLLLRLDFYSVSELVVIVRQRSRARSWEIDESILPEIARRSRGTPRAGIRLLEACRRVCRAAGESTITQSHLRQACELEQMDELGLGPIERQYLARLNERPLRLNVLASALGRPCQTVSTVIEPYLLRSGLVNKDDQGRRELTDSGRQHVSDCCVLRA